MCSKNTFAPLDVACTKPSVGDCFVIPPITKQSSTEGLVQATLDANYDGSMKSMSYFQSYVSFSPVTTTPRS